MRPRARPRRPDPEGPTPKATPLQLAGLTTRAYTRITMKAAALALLLSLGFVWPATAGDLRLEFQDGYVTLKAHDVPVRQILAEWARRGQTKITNGEKVVGTPVTLELTRVPEKQALE